jgi:hypothetical protein
MQKQQMSCSTINTIRLSIAQAFAYPAVDICEDYLFLKAKRGSWELSVSFQETRVFVTLSFESTEFDPLNCLGQYATTILEMPEGDLRVIGSGWRRMIEELKVRSRQQTSATPTLRTLSELP